jgi:hypothetical protein
MITRDDFKNMIETLNNTSIRPRLFYKAVKKRTPRKMKKKAKRIVFEEKGIESKKIVIRSIYKPSMIQFPWEITYYVLND